MTIFEYFNAKTDEELQLYYTELFDHPTNQLVAKDAEIRKVCTEVNALIDEGKIFKSTLFEHVHVGTVWICICQVIADRWHTARK